MQHNKSALLCVIYIKSTLMKLFTKIIVMLCLVLTPQFAAAQQRGKATHYAKYMNGHRTASGERLWNDSLICAHRTHKFGTLLKVRNLRNGKETVVRVIDRGPYIKGYVIDLSIAAARAIGLMGAGVVPVELTVVDKREPDDAPEAPND